MKSDFGYPSWKEEHKSILKNLVGKNIKMLFSGGKDSSVVMYFISKAAKEFGFDFTAHTGALPVSRYTDTEKKRIESYWIKRHVNITWYDIAKTDDHLRSSENPCLICQMERKKLLKDILTSSTEDWENLVIIVCFSLWDIVSYTLEQLLGDILSDSEQQIGIESNKRFKETAQRFYPIIKMKEGYTVFRPLIKYNNDDIYKIIAQEGIPLISIPCEFKDLRPKRILEKYYEKMGLRFNYNQLLAFAKQSLNLPDISSYSAIAKEDYFLDIF